MTLPSDPRWKLYLSNIFDILFVILTNVVRGQDTKPIWDGVFWHGDTEVELRFTLEMIAADIGSEV